MKHKTLFFSVTIILLALSLIQVYLMNFMEHGDLPPYAGLTLYIIAAWIILAIAFIITQRRAQ